METKQSIRKKIFKQRQEITDEFVKKESHILCERLCALKEFQEASCIYAYADYNKEVMTGELITRAWALGKRVAVPKVKGKEMEFYYITSFSQLEPGYFNIPEPVDAPSAEEETALMLVPGVAFDEKHHRIGYGQGFYDRYLSVHKEHKTIALAFDFQIIEAAPYEDTDIFPEQIVTPTRLLSRIVKEA